MTFDADRYGELPGYLDEACETIDAAFFTGDPFYQEAALARIEFYIGRWQRKIAEIRKELKDEEGD